MPMHARCLRLLESGALEIRENKHMSSHPRLIPLLSLDRPYLPIDSFPRCHSHTRPRDLTGAVISQRMRPMRKEQTSISRRRQSCSISKPAKVKKNLTSSDFPRAVSPHFFPSDIATHPLSAIVKLSCVSQARGRERLRIHVPDRLCLLCPRYLERGE